MGTFICDRCKKRWPDVAFYSCPDCYPRWALFQTILLMAGLCVFSIAFAIGIIAAAAWFAGRLT